MSIHGDRTCRKKHRFRCQACRTDKCWCNAGGADSELESEVCNDCWCRLTREEWRAVERWEDGGTIPGGPKMSRRSALAKMRSLTKTKPRARKGSASVCN